MLLQRLPIFRHRTECWLCHERPWWNSDISSPPSKLIITEGSQYLRSLRLTPKGLIRWYAGCCNTPVGNTLSAKLPFIGVIEAFISANEDVESKLGPVRGSVFVKSARTPPPASLRGSDNTFSLHTRILVSLLKWKIKYSQCQSPFFLPDGNPVCQPRIVKKK